MSNRGIVLTAIIAPVLVGFVLLKIEYSFFSISGPSERALQKEAEKVLVSLEKNEELSDESYIETDIGDLEVLFQVAKNIYGTDERNEEYMKIIDLGLKENKPGFSFIVAKNIYGTDERNAEYYKIVDKSLSLEKFKLALAVTRNIYGTDARNKKYKQIIAAGISKRSEEQKKSNEVAAESSSIQPTYNKALNVQATPAGTPKSGAH